MKKASSFLMLALFAVNLSLIASSNIRLQFQPDSPIDSIRIENLDNQTAHTFAGVNELSIFLGSPLAVSNPDIISESLRVHSSPDRSVVQIVFSSGSAGQVHCEVYDLQGRKKGSVSKMLEAGSQVFSFEPDARGVYLVRVTTAGSTHNAKFISYTFSQTPRLYADGFTTDYENSKAVKVPESTFSFGRLMIQQNDLLRIHCFSGTKTQTIYDYASGNKNYILRFTDRYHQFRLYDIVASKPSFVDVMFAVTDANHRGVDDLNNLDFVVKEDDVNVSASESFRHVQRMNQVPFQIKTVLMIDNSISIVNDLATVKEAALKFVKKVRPQQEIAVYVFSDSPVLLQDFSSDTLKLQQAINSITLGFPSTNLYGSIITALGRWNDLFTLNQLTQGSLIVFTDGNDTQGSTTLQAVLNARGTKRVYMVGLGNDLTPSVLNQISYPKEFISIQKAGELEETFNQIQADIVRYSNSFYWLNYMSPKRTGTRSLAVSTAGNTNSSATGSATGSFSANGFQSVTSGVYVNISDTKLYGIDSVFCFYDAGKYNFTLSRYGAIAGRDSLVLKPTTYWAFKQPNYTWLLESKQNLKLENAPYANMLLKAEGGDTISTSITLQDVANNYSKQLTVQMHPENPMLSISAPNAITGTSATFSGVLRNEGRLSVLSKGFVWSTAANPTVSLTTKTNSGPGKGSVNANVTALKTGTSYFVRAYASSSSRTNYSEQLSFSTEIGLPELTTTAVSSITINSANSGGNITHDGGAAITARGVCWSTSPNPTIADSISSNGTGSGSFTSSMTSLKTGTTFYVRAYATNSIGTSYGNEISFRTIGTVTSSTGKEWIDRNLGASRVATSITDAEAYGDLYQWGRSTDGHEKRTSHTTSTLSTSDTPAHGNFIIVNCGNYDWRSPQNNNLWQRVNGTNNPCPEGFRIPTIAEWQDELNSWGNKNSAGAFASPLKLPVAGYRNNSNGSLVDVGSFGFYWSSSADGTNAQFLYFSSNYAFAYSYSRAYGGSVRCIKATFTPTLTTVAVTGISSTSATSGGNITSDGGSTVTARGIVWSTDQNPTFGFETIDGSGSGSFASSLTGLKSGTKYYVKAYATNSMGTAYGNIETFTTSFGLPELTTTTVSSITTTSASSGGNITHDGGAAVTARGICWSTSPNPTIADSISSNETGSGSFTSSMTGLSPSTIYYVRAYATNNVGTAYGPQVSFSTSVATALVEVLSTATGKIWMDRNLGSSRVATSSTDSESYGDLYQWGRRTDGHEKRTSTTTSTLSSSDTPAHGNFITVNSGNYDWRSPQNNNLWQGVNGINNPCPASYRLPTITEWEAERASWSSNNSAGAFASPLKLPVAGSSNYSNGSLYNVGSNGSYWSGTVSGAYAQGLYFYSSSAATNSSYRANGFSVRCLKD